MPVSPLGSADVFVNVAGGIRIDEPGCGTSGSRSRSPRRPGEPPILEGLAAFGEIGLTGRLASGNPGTREGSRSAESSGVETVLAPDGNAGAALESRTRVRRALAAALTKNKP